MGYGGVISLKQTIQRLLDSSKFTVDSSTREILGFAYKEATSLQQLLGDCDGGDKRTLDRLDGQIRETVHKLEDFLELHQSDIFLDEDNLSIHSERVRQEINWFSERAKKLGEDYGAEGSADEEEDDAAPASSSNTGFCEEMVGLSDDLRSMERHVTSTLRPDDWGIMVIFGAAGTGRSLAAKKVLDDVMSCGELCFDYGVWVSVGPNYERERILQLILSQILKIDNGGVAGSEEQHKRCLWSRLEGRRYMIVLDDVCDTDIFDYLINMFPVQNNGSVVLVTTGAMVVTNHVRSHCVHGMSLYAMVDEFWDILRYVLLGKMNPVPPELEKAGRKIVWNCRGLRLCISKVLLYLWSAERSPEAWNEIAFDQHHPVFQIADEFLEEFIECPFHSAQSNRFSFFLQRRLPIISHDNSFRAIFQVAAPTKIGGVEPVDCAFSRPFSCATTGERGFQSFFLRDQRLCFFDCVVSRRFSRATSAGAFCGFFKILVRTWLRCQRGKCVKV